MTAGMNAEYQTILLVFMQLVLKFTSIKFMYTIIMNIESLSMVLLIKMCSLSLGKLKLNIATRKLLAIFLIINLYKKSKLVLFQTCDLCHLAPFCRNI